MKTVRLQFLPYSPSTLTTFTPTPQKLSFSTPPAYYHIPRLRSSLFPSNIHFAQFTAEKENKLRFAASETQSTVGVNNDAIDCTLQGGVVALGKFDALHIGHRELAIQASKAGTPFLLSFVGMAEVFGWEPRAPVVAKCDRKRVLSSWAPYCGSVSPSEFHVEFSSVRHLSPREFVEKLAKELGVRGVVAGENYRFGYKAAGDASELVKLCEEYAMKAYIVGSVMDKKRSPPGVKSSLDSKDRGQVSSTRVRRALAVGDIKYVSELLGRSHRLMLEGCRNEEGNRLSASKACLLNLPPKEGMYEKCNCFIGDTTPTLSCTTVIDASHVHVILDQRIPPFLDDQIVGVEFL